MLLLTIVNVVHIMHNIYGLVNKAYMGAIGIVIASFLVGISVDPAWGLFVLLAIDFFEKYKDRQM